MRRLFVETLFFGRKPQKISQYYILLKSHYNLISVRQVKIFFEVVQIKHEEGEEEKEKEEEGMMVV